MDLNKVAEFLEYRDGALYWKQRPGRKVLVGDRAGCFDKTSGYRYIRFDKKLVKEHRLIFAMHHGYFPEWYVDHINRDRLDNRIENLREVGPTCSAQNVGNTCGSTSPCKGVYWNTREQKWHASIGVDYKNISLGYYRDHEDAVQARKKKEEELGWC